MSRAEKESCIKASIVLPVFNASRYLSAAIDSVLDQTELDWELIIVNDGSTDDSLLIASEYARSHQERIVVIDQANRGASAARNVGIQQAQAELIAFIDADDLWRPYKLEKQLHQLKESTAEMVFCPLEYFSVEGRTHIQPMGPIIPGTYAPPSLVGTFLRHEGVTPGPQASMIRKSALAAVHGFEESIPVVYDDQALFLKLALRFRICFEAIPLVAYRQHDDSSITRMDRSNTRSSEEARFARWVLNYLAEWRVQDQDVWEAAFARLDMATRKSVRETLISSPRQALFRTSAPFVEYKKVASELGLRPAVKLGSLQLKALSKKVFRLARKNPVIGRVIPRIRFARGIAPLSEIWGSDRGVAIHRFYLESFLRENQLDIHGHVLDFQADTYASGMGGDRIGKVDVWHEDSTNPQATLWGDLTETEALPEDTFDCIICTHVLHLIRDPAKALRGLHKMLKPNGVLLIAVPQVSMNDPAVGELWRFTSAGLRLLIAEVFGSEHVSVRFYGNSLTSAADLRGYVVEELTDVELNEHDERFACEVCARAVKV